jgi:hypothetical protein
MVRGCVGLRPESDSAGEAQTQLYKQITNPFSHQRGRLMIRNPKQSKYDFNGRKKENWSRVLDCVAPVQTGRLTVGRKITLTLIDVRDL